MYKVIQGVYVYIYIYVYVYIPKFGNFPISNGFNQFFYVLK